MSLWRGDENYCILLQLSGYGIRRISDLLGNRNLQKAANSGSVPVIGKAFRDSPERSSPDKARELQDAASALANVSFESCVDDARVARRI